MGTIPVEGLMNPSEGPGKASDPVHSSNGTFPLSNIF